MPDRSHARRADLSGRGFLASYDAGRGQRYYLFGTNAGFLEIVNYYRTALKQKGELVYEEPRRPPVRHRQVQGRDDGVPAERDGEGLHVGRLRRLPQSEARRQPARFKTIIQIVPVPPAPPK